ncbi:hypothetical protein GDO86_010015 [Hymenochirus boettgeri]|uniref:Zonadhesin n=1 Tax=Hymenochirus boettgeri TaxID=247094 RepID=A0A8T2JRP3_9PIPI|nr:hypothetical protein GDO86_010015 [Hymenochirus boettgeri]
MGLCTYTLAKPCNSSTSLPYFNIEAKNEHRGDPSVSFVEWVIVEVYNQRIQIMRNESNRVLVNKIWTTLPVTLAHGLVTVTWTGKYVTMVTDFRLTVSYDTDTSVEVKVPSTYSKLTCGICGNFNNRKKDDYMMPNGQQAENSEQLGHSWIVDDGDPLCHPEDPEPTPPGGCTPEEEQLYKSDAFCGLLTSKDSPLHACNSVTDGPFKTMSRHVAPHSFYESCVFDQCVTGGNNDLLCNVLSSYAAVCESKGVSLGDWKNNTICALCSASGDPHYNTFDGAVHHYMGNCSYTLSKLCNDSFVGLANFHVYSTNDTDADYGTAYGWPNKKVTYVNSVHIEVYNYKFTLLKNKKLNVNGRRMNLPVTEKNRYSAYISGSYLVFETDFELLVRFDGNHYVDIALPSDYKGHLCGLCGNYNGVSGDDNIKKDGSIAMDSRDLGDSWIVASEEKFCGSQDLVTCDPLLVEEYSKNTFCGIIKDNTGIFKDCHSRVNPDNFFNNCLLDMCFSESKTASLCYAVQAYAQQCAAAGVCIEWRTSTFCPISCPGGSQYKTCGSGCPAACHNATSQIACNTFPVEGCFCNKGYVVSGDRCVEESECGCMDSKNNYYQLGESWFTNENCSHRCTCGQNNAIVCTEWNCGTQEKCQIKDGVLGCQPSGKSSCHVFGDPHFFTFDKVMHSFMGTCTYTLIKVCNSQNVIPVTINVKNENRGQFAATYIKEVYLDIYGISITLQKARRSLIDNQQIQTPWTEYRKGISIGAVGLYTVVETDFGMIVKFDGDHYLEIILPDSYYGKVCGLCGNYNGNKNDELLLPNGLQASNVTHFGNSWISERDKNCLDDTREDLDPPCAPDQKTDIENQCSVLLSDTFKPCHHLVDPNLFIKSCMYDMCRYNGMLSTLCAVVQSYVSACMTHGVNIKWRTSKLCPLPCPANSHYTDCASLCPSTCNDIYASAVCDKPVDCTEGCVCNDGYVLSGDRCVPLSQCGCRDSKDNYYNAGETWLTPYCTQVCECTGGNKIVCRPHGCAKGKCSLTSNGKYNCKPTGYAKCLIAGDPHYRTFDRLSHHFQGKDSYILTQTSSSLPELLEPFTIKGKNEPMNRYSRFTLIREVLTEVYNHTIIFSKKKKLVLDGVKTIPPVYLKEGIHIYQRPTRIYLETDFGLSVSFDGDQNADITVPNTHQNILEGLCGNYDGRSANDFRRPDGSQVRDVVTFGESWKVKAWKGRLRTRRDTGVIMEENPLELDTGDNLACSSSELALVNSSSFCGVLRETKGPFTNCHAYVSPEDYITNCLFDTCIEFQDTSLLCSNLEQYAVACQENGTMVDGWRESVSCGLPCGPNSKYKSCMNACPASCNNLASEAECEAPCSEGCQCDPGYVLSGFDCVPYRHCGCTYLNIYYQYGDTFITEDCTQNCTCTETSYVVCSDLQCKPNEMCTTANQIRDCYILGPCLENPCENGGTCVEGSLEVNSTNNMHCICPETHTGYFCEAEKKGHKDTIIYIVIGVVVGIFVIGFLFLFLAFCFFRRSKKFLIDSDVSDDGSVSLSRISVNYENPQITNEPDLINLAFEEDSADPDTAAVKPETNAESSTKQKKL